MPGINVYSSIHKLKTKYCAHTFMGCNEKRPFQPFLILTGRLGVTFSTKFIFPVICCSLKETTCELRYYWVVKNLDHGFIPSLTKRALFLFTFVMYTFVRHKAFPMCWHTEAHFTELTYNVGWSLRDCCSKRRQEERESSVLCTVHHQ